MNGRLGIPRVDDPRDLDVTIRISTIRIGVWSTLLVCAGVAVYAAGTADEPNRGIIAALLAFAVLSTIPVALLDAEKLVRGRYREFFFLGWTLSDIALLNVLVAADGGISSPMTLLLVLPLLFGSMSYPLWMTATAGVGSIAAFVAVISYTGGDPLYGSVGSFALFCATLMATWESNNQAHRRRELTESLRAGEASEARSLVQATQQEEVAVLGQRALANADTETLFDEAVGSLSRVLGVDIAAVMTLDDGRKALTLAAGVGLEQFQQGVSAIPLGKGTLAGYTVETQEPTTVADWSQEQRFELPGPMADLGLLSAIAVPISAGAQPYGAIIAQTTERRDFAPQDISFLVAIANVLGNAIDRRKREEQMRHDALHDPLTGLANRTLFVDRLRRALARSRRRHTLVGVLFIDLDDFKLVNDTLGHDAGDELIRSIAPRLVDAIRVTDTVARFGGDEFTVLIDDVDSEEQAMLVANRIIDALAEPFTLRDRTQHVAASVGIAVGDGSANAEGLMRDADTALYGAKAEHPGTAALFDGATRARVVERVHLEHDLRNAVANGELELSYQPIVAVETGRTKGLEALVRWRHPERGLLGPASFVPLAEEAGLIGAIGAWVLGEACKEAAAWQSVPGGAGVGVEVNISARQLKDSHFPVIVSEAVEAAALDPKLLRLELTESILLESSVRAEEMLDRLRGLGVGLVLDDFGTGYSSLGYLKRLPLDAIKLDRTFIESISHDSPDAAIVTATVELAKALGLEVVAEGVETAEQLAAIRALGCGYAQGFFIDRPVAADQVTAMLAGETVPPISG